MRRGVEWIGAVAGAVVLAVVAVGCEAGCGGKKGPAKVHVRMHNDTGADMNDFSLRHGDGSIDYQLFTKDYVFTKDVEVVTEGALSVSYTAGGERVAYELPEKLSPDMDGGKVIIYFRTGGKTGVYYKPAE